MPKPVKPGRDKSLATSPAAPSIAPIMTSDRSERDVAHRAYELYCARGCQNGHDVDDWLTAERELGDTSAISVLGHTTE